MTTQRTFQVCKRECEGTHSAFEHLIRTVHSCKKMGLEHGRWIEHVNIVLGNHVHIDYESIIPIVLLQIT